MSSANGLNTVAERLQSSAQGYELNAAAAEERGDTLTEASMKAIAVALYEVALALTEEYEAA